MKRHSGPGPSLHPWPHAIRSPFGGGTEAFLGFYGSSGYAVCWPLSWALIHYPLRQELLGLPANSFSDLPVHPAEAKVTFLMCRSGRFPALLHLPPTLMVKSWGWGLVSQHLQGLPHLLPPCSSGFSPLLTPSFKGANRRSSWGGRRNTWWYQGVGVLQHPT